MQDAERHEELEAAGDERNDWKETRLVLEEQHDGAREREAGHQHDDDGTGLATFCKRLTNARDARWYVESVKYGVLLLLCVGCSQNDCVLAGVPAVVSGTGSLSTDADAFTMGAVSWLEASAPTVTKSVSFSIAFGNGPSVACDGVAWAPLSKGEIVNVSRECVVIDGSTGAEAHLVGATLSATSTLDANDEGTVTLHFGVADQPVTLVSGDVAFTHVEVAVDLLVFDVAFAHSQCGGGSWGFWDI